MSYKDLLDSNSAILVGNGINWRGNNSSISWASILKSLDKGKGCGNVPKGYPLTEYFEIVNINRASHDGMVSEFIEKAKSIEPGNAHYELVHTCMDKGINILTTDFDHSIEKTGNFEKGSYRKLAKGFTDHYHWQRYYSDHNHPNSIRIWHVNGDSDYIRYVKLSVGDYSGCINYYRRFDPMRKGNKYKGDKTWINEITEKNLVIIGLALSEAEIFLRHVLIRRASYSRKKGRKLKGYFLTLKNSDAAKDIRLKFFLDSVNIEMKYFTNYDEMYDVHS